MPNIISWAKKEWLRGLGLLPRVMKRNIPLSAGQKGKFVSTLMSLLPLSNQSSVTVPPPPDWGETKRQVLCQGYLGSQTLSTILLVCPSTAWWSIPCPHKEPSHLRDIVSDDH